MRFKVTIEASFLHEVEVDAQNEELAKARASDALFDYLDLTLCNSQKFAEFHEYVLKERVVSVVEVGAGSSTMESAPQSPAHGRFHYRVALIAGVVLLVFCFFVFLVGLYNLPTLFK